MVIDWGEVVSSDILYENLLIGLGLVQAHAHLLLNLLRIEGLINDPLVLLALVPFLLELVYAIKGFSYVHADTVMAIALPQVLKELPED